MIIELAESLGEFLVIATLGLMTCALMVTHIVKTRAATVAAPLPSGPRHNGPRSFAGNQRPRRNYDPVHAGHPVTEKLRKEERKRYKQILNRSTIVIATPNHTAVALRYEHGSSATPLVTIKGKEVKGVKILEIARELDIPVFKSTGLAMQLYTSVDANKPIREEHFVPVAELVAKVVH
ncbi:EscU/YscU/HrcU family type III secretion system export apparatus switch protein [Pseudovibrio exalbescens]|uniref:EscU/YscU/HrcU family type III secretion system export apparatus switch protein n=1 Tax=Pseudovibrio exalbescens TaxID=197461 RepID=UPI0023668245|nr:EscU/YscU/HrcU family type III secretion system export apparatus switch protein [Pseudovibrio exalbescens]MDD7908812.1 EscU/YscU/HrcU family type III secretion system export apparatus switch protein [Pseudovibrio exalbescens]